MFPVYGGKCLSSKDVHNWVEKFFQGRSGWNVVAQAAEATVENLYAAGFDALLNRWDKCINVDGGYIEK
jgi:hypothetical protein